MGLSLIRASNENGEPVRASVTQIRAPGSTTLSVDAMTNWPSQFIATSGTLLSDGTLDPSTVLVFSGRATGSAITIEEIAPGYADEGNSVGQVVVIKPNTMWADNLANFLGTSLSENGGIAQLGGAEGIKFAVTAEQPDPQPDTIIMWFEPLE